ncbi:hypothetical protein V9T40_007042 [Parthenolecanium corni]|uniref:Phospholipase A2-like domain-containing protein n=1 Tax=Parthenolecanium corni TaxID=536013 RepID=A0AAN9TTT8_9HEMI
MGKNGILNSVIDSLPFPLHAPGTNYLGPGTPLAYNLRTGVKPTNKLDEAAMRHDIAYSLSKDLKDRHAADKILQKEAWARFKANDASKLEKLYGLATAGTMKLKRTLGAGMGSSGKRSTVTYQKTAVNVDDADLARINNAIAQKSATTLTIRYKRTKNSVVGETSLPLTNSQVTRLKRAREKRRNVKINLSAAQIAYLTSHNKTGGFLPAAALAAIPAIAAVGSFITGGVSAYNNKKANDRLIDEQIRHNKAMESLNSGKVKPLKNECAVVNLDGSKGPGTHWVCYIKRGNFVTYYDSFGVQPPPELIKYFGNLVTIDYNSDQVQQVDQVICGHLCLIFLAQQ